MDQHIFTNMLRSLFNIDGYQLPELTSEHQDQFLRDPVRYFIGTDKAQQDAIFREVMKRQTVNSVLQDMLEALQSASWLLADISPDGLGKQKVDAAISKALNHEA